MPSLILSILLAVPIQAQGLDIEVIAADGGVVPDGPCAEPTIGLVNSTLPTILFAESSGDAGSCSETNLVSL